MRRLKLNSREARSRPAPLLIAALALIYPAAPLSAADEQRPALFQKLVDCRAIADPQKRLSCYDENVAAMETAVVRKDVVVADREQVKKARKSLFGLTLPRIDLFGGGDDDKDEASESSRIETTIKSAYQLPTGQWVIIIEDGAKWVQTDTKRLGRSAKPGQPVRIRRAAMGSYFANVDDQIAIRMRREN